MHKGSIKLLAQGGTVNVSGKLDASAGKTPKERDLATTDELSELEKWERDRRASESKHTR